MKKLINVTFIVLLITGASSLKAQEVKKENKPTNATSKTLNKDLTKKVNTAKVMDATEVNPDGTIKEVKVNDKNPAKPKTINKTAIKKEKSDVVIKKVGKADGAIKQD